MTATDHLRDAARWLLGLFLIGAGTMHFLIPEEFLAQTPGWLPSPLLLVYVSGGIEIVLGLALLFVSARRRELGWITAAFFVAVLPGNIHQAVTGTAAFGLETPAARWGRLAFQPVFIIWALWATAPSPRHEPPAGSP